MTDITALLFVANPAPAPKYSIVNTVLVVVGTFSLVAITVLVSMKVIKRNPNRHPEDDTEE
jgi:hypothetical protein